MSEHRNPRWRYGLDGSSEPAAYDPINQNHRRRIAGPVIYWEVNTAPGVWELLGSRTMTEAEFALVCEAEARRG